jgi:hypothetical protein
MLKLVHMSTQKEVEIGEVLKGRNGEVSVTGWEEPRHAASSGRVYVLDGSFSAEYFPHVFDLEFIGRTDR